MPKRTNVARHRCRRGEILDAYGRPFGEKGTTFVYTVQGEIHHPKIVVPDEVDLREALQRHIEAIKVLRPLTAEERQTFFNIKKLGLEGGLLDFYTELISKTPNPAHTAQIEALIKEKERLQKAVRRVIVTGH